MDYKSEAWNDLDISSAEVLYKRDAPKSKLNEQQLPSWQSISISCLPPGTNLNVTIPISVCLLRPQTAQVSIIEGSQYGIGNSYKWMVLER